MSERQIRRGAVAVMLIGALYVIVDGFGANDRRLATLAAVYGILVLSLVVLTGFVGQISFMQVELMGFGALTTAGLSAKVGWSIWLAIPVAVGASVAVGVVVGLPALRLRGLILGVVTLALAQAFDAFVFTLGPFNDIAFISRPSLLGWDLGDDRSMFVFCLAVLCVCALLVANLQRAKTGRIFAAIRDSEVAARTAGVDVTRYKLTAFGISAGLAGLAGALLVITIGAADKQSFVLSSQVNSLSVAAVIVLMGPSLVAAAFAGGVFLSWGGDILDRLGINPAYFNVVLGVGLIAQLIAAPDGVVVQTRHNIELVRRLFRSRRLSSPMPEIPAP